MLLTNFVHLKFAKILNLMLSVLVTHYQNKTLMDKSEAWVTCLQDSQRPGKRGCSCGLLSTFFPSTPRPHLLQVKEERTILLLIPSQAPLQHYPSKKRTQLLRTPSCFLKFTHLPLDTMATKDWSATADGRGKQHGQWSSKGTGARQTSVSLLILFKSLRHAEPVPHM